MNADIFRGEDGPLAGRTFTVPTEPFGRCDNGHALEADGSCGECAADEVEQAAAVEHRIRWFVRVGLHEWIPRTSSMRGLWFYDAKCSCGWESRTGGATRRAVSDAIWLHKVEEGAA